MYFLMFQASKGLEANLSIGQEGMETLCLPVMRIVEKIIIMYSVVPRKVNDISMLDLRDRSLITGRGDYKMGKSILFLFSV